MAKNLTRNDLYDLVWQKPITEVAKEYGLSDRGLSKLCERYGIPVPPRGYWSKIQNGHKAKIPQLISLDSKVDKKIIIDSNVKRNSTKLPDNLKDAITAEKQAKNKILVPESISNYHSIIAKWNKNDFKKQTSCLEKRRRKIFSVLLDALDSRGFWLEESTLVKGQVIVNYQQSSISFSINQHIKRSYEFLNGSKKATNEATQNLVLKIYSSDGIIIKTFAETKEASIENILNNVIVYIIKKLWNERKEYLERQDKLAKSQQDQQIKVDEEALELQKITNLEQNLKNWLYANQIKEYVAFVQKSSGEDTSAWCEWALNYSNKLEIK